MYHTETVIEKCIARGTIKRHCIYHQNSTSQTEGPRASYDWQFPVLRQVAIVPYYGKSATIVRAISEDQIQCHMQTRFL